MKVKLEDVCDVRDGTHESPNYTEQGYPLVTSKNIVRGRLDLSDVNYICKSDYDKINIRSKVNTGDIIMPMIGTIGNPYLVEDFTDFAIKNVALIKFNHSKVNNKFLLYFLTSNTFSTYVKSKNKGGTQKFLALGDIRKMEIPLLDYESQLNIVNQLDRVSNLLSLRHQQLEKLDLLVKSRFVEMFGDPENNPKKFELKTIGDEVKSIEAGWSGNGEQRIKKAGEIAVLKVSAVTKGYFIPEECKVLNNQSNIKKYVYPEKGDIIFSRANTKEMVGATVLIEENYPELILPDKLWKVRFKDSINPYYMKYELSSKSIRKKFSEASTGTSGSMYNVSMEKFKSVIIIVPPLSLQNQFADFVQQVDKSKFVIKQSIEKLELLKNKLMQDYFG